MHIYACKFYMVIQPKLEGFVKRIVNVYNIEKYIAEKNKTKHIYSNING